MKLKSLDIGRLSTKNNLFFAPMAGYSDYAFRGLCSVLGAGVVVTEMVSAKGLMYKNENTSALLEKSSDENLTIAQIFGHEPDVMRAACESEFLNDYPIIDVNMGCPVNKIYGNGEGSKLMETPDLAEKIISECSKSGKTITVKFRAGIRENELIAADFAKMAEQAGAKLITIHGRTKEGMYSGPVHFDEIARAKAAVSVPVIANGGIFTPADADEMIEKTGADGVAVARGALFDPLIFSRLSGNVTNLSLVDCVEYLIEKRKLTQPDVIVAHALRKFVAQLFKGVRGGKEAKLRIFAAENTAEILTVCREYLV